MRVVLSSSAIHMPSRCFVRAHFLSRGLSPCALLLLSHLAGPSPLASSLMYIVASDFAAAAAAASLCCSFPSIHYANALLPRSEFVQTKSSRFLRANAEGQIN
jgi:hypothetical protein